MFYSQSGSMSTTQSLKSTGSGLQGRRRGPGSCQRLRPCRVCGCARLRRLGIGAKHRRRAAGGNTSAYKYCQCCRCCRVVVELRGTCGILWASLDKLEKLIRRAPMEAAKLPHEDLQIFRIKVNNAQAKMSRAFLL